MKTLILTTHIISKALNFPKLLVDLLEMLKQFSYIQRQAATGRLELIMEPNWLALASVLNPIRSVRLVEILPPTSVI